MPSNMSFSHTTEQIINRTKTVTRRLGWKHLKPGEQFWAVRKTMGLKPGEQVERLELLECVSNTREPLNAITEADVEREGFPGKTADWFMSMFRCIGARDSAHPRCGYDEEVSRIEFEYVPCGNLRKP